MKGLARTKTRRSDKLSRALKERDEALAFQAATEDIIARNLECIQKSVADIYHAKALVQNDERLGQCIDNALRLHMSGTQQAV